MLACIMVNSMSRTSHAKCWSQTLTAHGRGRRECNDTRGPGSWPPWGVPGALDPPTLNGVLCLNLIVVCNTTSGSLGDGLVAG